MGRSGRAVEAEDVVVIGDNGAFATNCLGGCGHSFSPLSINVLVLEPISYYDITYILERQ